MIFKKLISRNLPIVAAGALVAVLAAIYFFSPGAKSWVNEAHDVLTSDDPDRVRDYVSQYGMWGPLAIIVAMAIQMFLFVVPNVLLMMIAILSYGPVWGSLISFVGIFLASSLGYFVGNKLSPSTLRKLISKKNQEKIGDFIDDYGVMAIVITRMTSFSNDGLSFVAGLLGMKYRSYILATLTGITPLILTLAIFGRNGKIEKALIWIAIASLLMLTAYIYWDKRRKKANANYRKAK